LDQSERTGALRKREEREREDVWWVDPGGENAEQVAADIASALATEGLPWYARHSEPEAVLDLVEAERDCFIKFARAALIAKYLGDVQRWQKYDALAECEARRIGRSLDRSTWDGI
jgi:hypothetical protein